MKPVVYLAGPIAGLTYEQAANWRDQCKGYLERAGWVVLSPMRGKEALKNTGPLSKHGAPEIPCCEPGAIFARDTADVASSDLVLFNFGSHSAVRPPPSVGSLFELGLAWGLGKDIVVVQEPDSATDHLFVRQAARAVVRTLGAALEFLNEWKEGWDERQKR